MIVTLSPFRLIRRGSGSLLTGTAQDRHTFLAFFCLSLFFCIILFSVFTAREAAASGELSFLKGLFVKEVRGYGLYVEEESSRFKKGSKATVYLEVDNFQLGIKDEQYHISLSLDLLVKNKDGKVIAEDTQVMTHEYLLKSRIRDVWFTVIMDLSEWPEGTHILSFVVTDNTTGKQCTKDMEIEIH